MIDGKTVLAIVPARGGSKGLPRKNILPFGGKPLIAWTIEAAQNSKYIDRCVVSTDDEEIASIAKEFGADIPFIRPMDLATDNATTNDVILHAIEALSENFDLVVLLQPTSPLRDENIVDDAMKCFVDFEVDSLVSVNDMGHPVEWSFTLENCKIPKQVIKELQGGKRRQDYPKRYQLNGAICICAIETYKYSHTFFMDNTFAYKMENNCSVDIDSNLDFKIAELFIKTI